MTRLRDRQCQCRCTARKPRSCPQIRVDVRLSRRPGTGTAGNAMMFRDMGVSVRIQYRLNDSVEYDTVPQTRSCMRSAHCALPVPVSRGSRLEIPGVRLRGRLAILVQSWNLGLRSWVLGPGSRVSSQLYAMCMCLRLVLILGLTPRRTKLSVNAPRSTPDPGLVLGCSNSSY